MPNLPQSFRPTEQAAFALQYLLERERRAEQQGETVKAAGATDVLNQAVIRLAREQHQRDHLNDQSDRDCKICKQLAAPLPTGSLIGKRKAK